MADISEATHVDKADAWDRNAQKNSLIKSLRDEVDRLRTENYELRCRIQILNGASVENTELDSHLKEAD